MTLEGAKFICLDEAGNHGEVVLAKGRKFTMGYYVNCDYVLVDERAKGVHCEIECDAFGRVTIRNLSPDKPILVNDSSVEIKRILLNNSKLSVLGKEYLWIFPNFSTKQFEELPVQDVSTPQKTISIPERAPNSCPEFKLCRDLPKRLTVHNFAYCIHSDEEGNTSSESNAENDNENVDSTRTQIKNHSEIQSSQLMEKDSKDDTSQAKGTDKEKENRYRCITPDPNEQMVHSNTEPLETPKMNLINYTKDKENSSTQKKNKLLLQMCHQSDIVITSFSPRETGVKICKSFAAVIKPKVLVTKPPTTPQSVYSTPKGDMNVKDQGNGNQSDLIAFNTPSTSKKIPGSATGLPISSIKVLKNSSMHLIDLTTPNKLRPASPYLKSNLKAPAKKNISINIDKSCTKVSSGEQLAMSDTPVITNATNTSQKTPSSVINVSSTIDNSSVIELTSDGSNMGLTHSAAGLNTPLKAQTRVGVCTPKRTPQSLIKRAILTSAKKQNTAPQLNIQNPTTPRREAINRMALRGNLALSKTPVTPQISNSSSSISQSPKRMSLSTPIRKNVSQRSFDISNIAPDSPSTSAKTYSRRSSINPISAAKALTTSTPVSGKSVLIRRIGCNTSSLHKVRKTLGGIPLSSHISRARKSIVLSASSSIKEKSTQQVISDRLVNRARKSVSSRSCKLVEGAKTPRQTTCQPSIHKEKTIEVSAKTAECRPVSFAKENTEDDNDADILSRTFVLDSIEDANNAVQKDATFSPEKDSIEKVSIPDKKGKLQSIEIPVDADEVVDSCIENDENTHQINEKNSNTVASCHEIAIKKDKLKDGTDNATIANRIKTIITEESFAEEINASMKPNSATTPNVVLEGPVPSSPTEKQTCFAEIKNKNATKELGQDTSVKNDNDNRNAVETGFGEESSVEVVQTSSTKMALNKETQITAETHSQSSQPDMLENETKNELEKVLLTKAEKKEKSLVEQADEVSKIETKTDDQSSNEYKPLVEDITLEGSLIEKETKDSEDNNTNKQLYIEINLKDSLIEEKVKSEEIKEENTKIAVEEPEDKEQVSASSKDNEMSAHSQTMKQINTEVANITSTTEESSTKIQEKAATLAAKTESAGKFPSNPIDMELLYRNQYAKNVEVKNETTKTPHQEKRMQSAICHAKTQEDGSKPNTIQVSQPEQVEVGQVNEKTSESMEIPESLINYKIKIENNLDDTSKLLEEIEDVLNKSDEIKQKQLNEIEQSSNKPLTEALESEQFSQEKAPEITELQETGPGQTDHVAEISFCNKYASENKEKQITGDIVEEVSKSAVIEKYQPKLSVRQTSIISKININLDTDELQIKNVAENISKQTDTNNGSVAPENTQRNDQISHIQTLDDNFFANDLTATNSNKSSHITEQNTVIEMDNNSKRLNVVNRIVEKIASLTPRRSTRRASQSSDVTEITPELKFTPRRSARRSSMSAESATTTTLFTPVKRTTRRASASILIDTTLTPKSITKRRFSISVEDDESARPSSSKLQQGIQTPRKQLERTTIIPEGNNEICNAIMEGDEELEQERVQFVENKTTPYEKVKETETERCVESRERVQAETVLESKTTCQKDLSETTNQTQPAASESLEFDITQAHFDDKTEKLQREVQTHIEKSSDNNTEGVQEPSKGLNPDQLEAAKNENIVFEEKLSQQNKYQQSEEMAASGTASISIQETDDDNATNTASLEHSKVLVHSPKMRVNKGEFEDLIHTANLKNVPETLSREESLKNPNKVNILCDSPHTPLMTGVRELLKTPKPESQTPRLAGIRNLICTPKRTEVNEAEEMEKLAVISDLVKSPEISTPKTKKHILIGAESPKTPLLMGLSELLKTPKAELNTPKYSGIQDLLKTPNSCSQNEQEATDKLTMVAELLKTPEYSKIKAETPASSMKGVKEQLRTPKHLTTAHFKGMRELLKTPKVPDTPNTTGVKELLETPEPQTCADVQVSNAGIENTNTLPEDLPSSTYQSEIEDAKTLPEELPSSTCQTQLEDTQTLPEDLPSSTTQSETSLMRVKQLLKTPKSCSTPRRTGRHELITTPMLSHIKELLDENAVQQKDKELEKFLRTPTAKNIMIPSMPSSAVIEKSSDSIEVSTEYDLNATNEAQTSNLEELFKSPGAAHFVERISESYYGEEKADEAEILQGELNKSAEDSFDKLIGQESQIQTPVRKTYARKSFTLQTPTCSSPFTAAEILSDLPKTDVEEWIESLDQAESPTTTEYNKDGEGESEEVQVNKELGSLMNTGEICSIGKEEQTLTLNESIIPETCAKVFVTGKSFPGKPPAFPTYADSKDPLLNTYTEVQKALSPVTSTDAEISGINFLDQTVESVQDEPSMLDEALFVEEPSMFDEPLVVSDESEGERTQNFSTNPETSEDGGNELSEPLLLSDSEDLNFSHERDMNNKTVRSELEVTETRPETDIQEKSMLEKLSSKTDLLAEDPLEIVDKMAVSEEQSSIIKIDVIKNEADCSDKSVGIAEADESKSTNDNAQILKSLETVESERRKSLVEIDLPTELTEESNCETVNADIVVQESSDKLKNKTTSPIEDTVKDTVFNVDINSIIEHFDAEVVADEIVSDETTCADFEKSPIESIESKQVTIEQIKIVSLKSENMFVDTSVAEICAETNVLLNEEETGIKSSPKKTPKKETDSECQDIFMDNSNIDESFGDEAINEENNTGLRATTTKMSIGEQKVLYPTEAVLPSQTSKHDSNLKATEQSISGFKNSENTQFETTTGTTSETVIIILDESSNESAAETTSVTEMEPLLIEIAESQSNQGGYTEQENSKIELSTTTSVQESVNVLNEVVQQTENEKLESYSKVADKTLGKTSAHVLSETSENAVTPNASAKESLEISANEIVSSSVEYMKQLSGESKNNETINIEDNNKLSETYKCPESVEEQYWQTNITPESAEISANIESRAEDIISRIEEISNNVEENPKKEIQIHSATDFQQSAEKEITLEENVATTVAISTQQVSSVEKQTKSTSEERTFLEECDNTPTQTIKYDFVIQIDERNHLEGDEVKLDELTTTSSQVKRSQTYEVTREIIKNSNEKHQNINKYDENSPDEILENSKAFEEMREENVNAVKIVPKKNTITESNEQSAKGEEIRKSSRRDWGKGAEIPAEEKTGVNVEDIKDHLKDTIADLDEYEKSNIKPTASVSSHDIVAGSEAGYTTRKGGRRKNQNTNEPIAREELKKEEVIILQQLEDKEAIITAETKTETTENFTGEEKTAVVTVIHEAPNIVSQKETTPEEKQTCPNFEKTMFEKLAVVEQDNTNLSVSIEQYSNRLEEREIEITKEILTDPLGDQQFPENIAENQTSLSEVIKIEKSNSAELPDKQSVDDKNIYKSTLSSENEAPQHTPSAVAIHGVAVEETEQLPYKRVRRKPSVSESSQDLHNENTHLRKNISIVQNNSVEVTLVPEVDQVGQESTIAKIINKAKTTSEKEEAINTILKAEDVANKRSRRNPNLSESSQDSQLADGNILSANNRHKLKKDPVVEALGEESQEGEEVLLTEMTIETDEINTRTAESSEARQDESDGLIPDVDRNVISNLPLNKTDEVSLEAKELSRVHTLTHRAEQANEVPTVSSKVAEPAQKRSRDKITKSESNVENEISRTRRGGRKVQKVVVEELQMEQEYEGSSLELIKSEENVTEAFNLEAGKDEDTNKTENRPKIEEAERTDKHKTKLKKESLEEASSEYQESQVTVSRRGRNKPAIKETSLEEQTTSRKGRRKAVLAATVSVIAETESEVQSAQVEAEKEGEVPNDDKVVTNMDSSLNKTGKRRKQHKIDVEKLSKENVVSEEDMNPRSSGSFTEHSEKETFPKDTAKRGRQRKADDTKGMNPESTPKIVPTPNTRRGGRHKKETAEIAAPSVVHKGRSTNRSRKTPVEHITGDSQIEHISATSKSANDVLAEGPTTQTNLSSKVTEETANIIVPELEFKEDKKSILVYDAEQSVKIPVKRTHSPYGSNQQVDEPPVEQSKHEMPFVETSDNKGAESDLTTFSLEQNTDGKNVSDEDEKLKEVGLDVAVKPQKPAKRKALAKHEKHDKHFEEPTTKSKRRSVAEDVIEPKNENVLLPEVRTADDDSRAGEVEEPSVSTRRRAVARHVEHNQDTSTPAIKRRTGRAKQVVEDHETEEEHFNLEEANKIDQMPDPTETHKQKYDTGEEPNQTKTGEATSRRRNIGKKKVEKVDIQFTEDNKEGDNRTDIDISQEDKPDVDGENHQAQEETKRGRVRKKKIDHKEQSKDPAAAHSPVTKSKGRKRKEINTDVTDHISKEEEHVSENIEQQPHETPVRTAPTLKKDLNIIDHITAESLETEDTPSRRARNVPQRKAATAYHNYDETSDSETTSKTKKKTDTARKSLEATKKSPVAQLSSAPTISVSPAPSSTPSITTARGRTRKPTAKVQQYLEEERAKAETPKRRALLATAAANADVATSQRTPARRGRKASNIEIEVEGTPQTSKSRGRGKFAALQEESSALPAATTTSEEGKNLELLATATTQSSTKVRVGGRKAKMTDEEKDSTDEPPAKKHPLELESEKQEPTPSSDYPTPTRIAGRRNAAAAAKARIEEDALAAAAIEPPKRVRAKRATQKASTQLVTSTDADNVSPIEAEEGLNTKPEKEVKNKSHASKKREHRLASASTAEGIEDVQVDDETETKDNAANKRGRKPTAITTTDSPAVPAKRGRKAKVAETVSDPMTPVESKSTRGRGRGRKNVHFDELEAEASSSQQNETDVEPAPADISEPVKKGTRTRRK